MNINNNGLSMPALMGFSGGTQAPKAFQKKKIIIIWQLLPDTNFISAGSLAYVYNEEKNSSVNH